MPYWHQAIKLLGLWTPSFRLAPLDEGGRQQHLLLPKTFPMCWSRGRELPRAVWRRREDEDGVLQGEH